MTENENRPTDEEITATGPQRRPGQELAAARERAGISFETMAEGLRLPKRQLQALEADDYASLPPPTYIRGYIRAYAREVGLDGDDIVALFDAGHGDVHDPDLHPAVPSGSAAGGGGLPIGLAVIAVVVIAGIGGWWWQGRPPADAGAPGADMPAAESAGQADAASTAEQAAAGQDAAEGSGDDAETRAAATTPDEEPAQSERVAEAAVAESGTSTSTLPEPDDAGAQSPESPATPEDDMAAGAGGAGASAGADDAADPEATRAATAGDAAASQEAAGAAGDEATEQAAGASQEAAGPQGDEATEQAAGAAQEGAGLQVAEGGQQEGADTEESEARQHDSPPATSDPEEAATPAAAVGPDTLVLRVDGRSWMEVYDAGERELVYTLYLGSEPLRLQGWAPFDVFLGNSPAVTVTLNGREVAKSAFTRSDNTARFLIDEDGARRR